MSDTLLNIVFAVVILGGAAVVTQLFTRWMYRKCASCGALNAHRRTHCRVCGTGLK